MTQLKILKVRANHQTESDFINFALGLPYAYRFHDSQEELLQIRGQHILSSYYHFDAYLGYIDNQVVIRGALSHYGDEAVGYLGYFESIHDQEVVDQFMTYIEAEAKQRGIKELIGPVQSSIWIGYRMKVENFQVRPYTGEPYNLDYYPDLWLKNGYQVMVEYFSNMYQTIPQDQDSQKLKQRYEDFVRRGYEFRQPQRDNWDQITAEVFMLLSRAFERFPLYRPLKESEFQALFADYPQILDFSLVQLAYYQENLVGVFISLPDYGDLLYGPLSWLDKLKILKRRIRAQRYILLYLAIDPNHPGLGSALAHLTYQKVKARKAQSIGALILNNNISGAFVKELQGQRQYYHLYHKKI